MGDSSPIVLFVFIGLPLLPAPSPILFYFLHMLPTLDLIPAQQY
jgi:hypothetical protein